MDIRTAGTDALADERRRWFDAIVTTAADYAMSGPGDAGFEARQAMDDAVDNAVYHLSPCPMPSEVHHRCRLRVQMAAEDVGHWFKTVHESMSRHLSEVAIETVVARYLTEREALRRRLEAIPPF